MGDDVEVTVPPPATSTATIQSQDAAFVPAAVLPSAADRDTNVRAVLSTPVFCRKQRVVFFFASQPWRGNQEA